MTSHSVTNQLLPLSPEGMDELDSFLMSDATSDETMSLDTLDGYLMAIVVGPTTLDFGQWFSGIWGPNKEDAPNFKSMEEAQHIIGLIIRQMNGIILDLEDDPDDIMPIFNTVVYPDNPREYTDAEMWAYGFMCGINLCLNDWQPFFDDPNSMEVIRPLHLLGSDNATPEEIALIKTPDQREELALQIPASVAWIYRFWLPYRHAIVECTVTTTIQRNQTKIGRNDPCPC
jgi:uncharacterized protein